MRGTMPTTSGDRAGNLHFLNIPWGKQVYNSQKIQGCSTGAYRVCTSTPCWIRTCGSHGRGCRFRTISSRRPFVPASRTSSRIRASAGRANTGSDACESGGPAVLRQPNPVGRARPDRQERAAEVRRRVANGCALRAAVVRGLQAAGRSPRSHERLSRPERVQRPLRPLPVRLIAGTPLSNITDCNGNVIPGTESHGIFPDARTSPYGINGGYYFERVGFRYQGTSLPTMAAAHAGLWAAARAGKPCWQASGPTLRPSRQAPQLGQARCHLRQSLAQLARSRLDTLRVPPSQRR